MSWKWNEIQTYKASVGGEGGNYYANIQLFGKNFYVLINFKKTGPLPNSYESNTFSPRFYGFMNFEQYHALLDLLRNEEPVRFGYNVSNQNLFHLMTSKEEVGEGDGI